MRQVAFLETCSAIRLSGHTELWEAAWYGPIRVSIHHLLLLKNVRCCHILLLKMSVTVTVVENVRCCGIRVQRLTHEVACSTPSTHHTALKTLLQPESPNISSILNQTRPKRKNEGHHHPVVSPGRGERFNCVYPKCRSSRPLLQRTVMVKRILIVQPGGVRED